MSKNSRRGKRGTNSRAAPGNEKKVDNIPIMGIITFMNWTVFSNKRAQKQAAKLPIKIRKILARLLMEMEKDGPYRNNWQNYGALSKNRFHCHLKRGKPTYVAVWEMINKEIRLIEVTYVGTHEKAPY